jgi:hypothetical protein
LHEVQGPVPKSNKAITPPAAPSSESSQDSQTSPDADLASNWWEPEQVNSPQELVVGNDHSILEDTYSTLIEIAPNYDFMPFSPVSSFDTIPISTGHSPTYRVVPDEQKWKVSNDALVFGINSGIQIFRARHQLSRDEERKIWHSHAAYKAILWGCDEREERERRNPLWLALRLVDEKVFGNWTSKAQKIAMMFVCHRMLLYKTNPCKETLERVPSWFRPRCVSFLLFFNMG